MGWEGVALPSRTRECSASLALPRKYEMTILTPALPVVRPRLAVPRYASWQDAMKDAVRDPDELCRLLGLPAELAAAARAAARQFPLFVPRGYLARMRPGDPADPLLRQVLPLAEELADVPGFVADPVGDAAATRQPGLLQKYHGRVLFDHHGRLRGPLPLLFPAAFSVRRVAPFARRLASRRSTRLRGRRSLREVILSGGDPLTLVDATSGRAGRAIGGDSASPPTADSHAAADRDSGAGDR